MILTGIIILYYCNQNEQLKWVTIVCMIVSDIDISFRTYSRITWLQRNYLAKNSPNPSVALDVITNAESTRYREF